VRNKLNILSNNKVNNFLSSLLSEYDITFMKFDRINYKLENGGINIVFINNEKDLNLINFNYLKDNCLIISSLKSNRLNLNTNLKLINTPVSINHIINEIENFIQNLKIQFHDISIDNEKITNLSNNSFCYLTKLELEILKYLIREKETTKEFIKENILNIKSNIETNSLESHLTRIRKKMNIVKTKVKIQTKSEKLIIKA
tara:strand:+ start:128 stop:730 length:603 start_codon:yes stop_codon:yes gene_type:complete